MMILCDDNDDFLPKLYDLIKFVWKSGRIDKIILAENYFVAPSESSQFQNHISYFTGQPELWQLEDGEKGGGRRVVQKNQINIDFSHWRGIIKDNCNTFFYCVV